jgi:hypothetical protein
VRAISWCPDVCRGAQECVCVLFCCPVFTKTRTSQHRTVMNAHLLNNPQNRPYHDVGDRSNIWRDVRCQSCSREHTGGRDPPPPNIEGYSNTRLLTLPLPQYKRTNQCQPQEAHYCYVFQVSKKFHGSSKENQYRQQHPSCPAK